MSDSDKETAVVPENDEQPVQQTPDDTSNWDDKDATVGDNTQKHIRSTDSDDIVE